MATVALDLLRCPECRGRTSALDADGASCPPGASADAARVVVCQGCSRWFPVVDGIPRLLPDSFRDITSDEEFYKANAKAFAKLPGVHTHFGQKAATADLYRHFQKQRLLWGEQERWEDLYQAPVQYTAPKRRKWVPDSNSPLRFFSMNLHCDYGDFPRKDQIVQQVGAAGGKLTLDVGCGGAKNRMLLEQNGNRYVGLDLQGFSGPDVQASATQLPFEEGTFDFIICDSVLEHVPEPWKVTSELFRVLKPGGQALLVVPFIYKNHGAPFDFFRYTKSGLHTMLRSYSVVRIYSFGGFFHVVSHMVESVYSHIPVVGRVLKAIHNTLFFFLNKLDRFDRYRIFCRGYYALAVK